MKLANVLVVSILVAIAFIAIQGMVYAQPVASFTANQTSGDATPGNPFVVQFTDQSTGNPTSWQWNFGDGTANSTQQDPVHSYLNAGVYNVTLTVSDGTNYNTIQEIDYINVPLWINGAVDNDQDLTVSQLNNNYPQEAVVDCSYRAHGSSWSITASGPSLMDLLYSAGINDTDAQSVTFVGSDGYSDTVSIPTIEGYPTAMIATQWSTTDDTSSAVEGLRNVFPEEGYASDWVYDLDGMTVNA